MRRNNSVNLKMRIIHRYLGFFLAGIMAMYALSGITLIFRDTSFLKKEIQITKKVKPLANGNELKGILKIKNLQIIRENENRIDFEKRDLQQTNRRVNLYRNGTANNFKKYDSFA